MSSVSDTLGRQLRDLRISVTDRCNFRCTYCMPREVFGPDHAFVERGELLTFEEIVRTARAFAARGVRTLRLTGGEPLLRRDVPRLVTMLADIDGIEELAMTTNGALLANAAGPLAAAGLGRVTVSLDALDPHVFAAMADTRIPIGQVLAGLDAADAAGLHPIKVNAVVRRGVNEDQIVPLARLGRERGYTVRFIEYMDVGTTNGWAGAEVVPAAEIAAAVDAAFPIDVAAPSKAGETALRYRYRDGAGEMGIIASVTQPFCGACSRARISPIGEVFTCLFAGHGADIRALLRSGADEAALVSFVEGIWTRRSDRYSELRAKGGAGPSGPRVEMSYIGG